MHWNVMSRGQIVFYAFLALIALIQAFGLTALVWLVHLFFIALAAGSISLWGRTWKEVWNRCERKSQKLLVLWFGGFGVIAPPLLVWRVHQAVLQALSQWIEVQ